MAASWKDDPRMTTALREFGNVSQDYSLMPDSKNTGQMEPSLMTWQELVTSLWTGCKQRKSSKQLRSFLLELLSQAGEMIGEEESVELKESLAVEIFLTTMSVEQVETKHVNKIREKLQTVRNDDIRDFHEIVKKIRGFVGQSVFNKIISQVEEIKKATMFGTKIKFSSDLPSLLQSGEMDSDDEMPSYSDKITDSFRQLTVSQVKAAEKSTSLKTSASGANSYDSLWLKKKLMQYFNSDHFSPSIMALLQSTSSNDQLQNELFDLLGFDRFELIQELFEHREDLVKNQKRKEIFETGSKVKTIESRPTFGCQVTVQTDQEKQLAKAFRREEKRMAKKTMKNENEEESELLDPTLLREQRLC